RGVPHPASSPPLCGPHRGSSPPLWPRYSNEHGRRVIPAAAGTRSSMGELVGENYGDNHSDDVPSQEGTKPGDGRLDQPATTGTHRGWGDPQAGEDLRDDDTGDDTGKDED